MPVDKRKRSINTRPKGIIKKAKSHKTNSRKTPAKRRLAEEQSNQLAAIVRFSNDAIIGKTLDGIITSWNQAAENIYGYTEPEVIGRPLSILVPPDREDEIPQLLGKIRRGERVEYFETVRRRKDGRDVSVSITISPVKDSKGRVIGASTIARDVTERKRIEEALRNSEEQFRTLFENSSCALAIIEPDTTISMVNKEYCKLGMFEKKDVVGISWTSQIPPKDLERMKEYNRRRLADPNNAPDHYEFSFYRKDGEIRDCLMSVAIIPTNRKIICSFTDITERKRAEEALRENEQNYRTLADSGRALVWAAGTDKLCNYFNFAWLEFTGRTIEQEMGNGWADGVHPDDLQRCLEIYTGAFDRRENFSMEYRLRRHDGAYRWILDDGSPRHNSKGEFIGYIGHCLDITDQKNAEESFRKSSEMVQLLLNSTAEAIYGLDMNGKCTFSNAACLQILGYDSPDELLGRNMHEMIHSKHADGSPYDVNDCPIFKAFKAGTGIHTDNEVLWHRDGTSFPAEYWSYPMHREGKLIGAVVTFIDIAERKATEHALQDASANREKLITELQHALENIKTLQGLIPICVNCKKIRDDRGYWNQVEEYIGEHTDATFSHGLCPDCIKKLYGDKFIKNRNESA